MGTLEDNFLKELQLSQAPVSIFLMTGVRLHGTVEEFDDRTIYLHREGVTQLVYKSGIVTVLPEK